MILSLSSQGISISISAVLVPHKNLSKSMLYLIGFKFEIQSKYKTTLQAAEPLIK